MDAQTDSGIMIGQNEDLTQILPIQQKRTIACINGFIMQTVSFLNKFAQSCESQFMELEYRIQKIEASLLILESQLSSIEGLNSASTDTSSKLDNNITNNEDLNDSKTVEENLHEKDQNEIRLPDIETKSEESIVKIDPIYQKYFKLVQVGAIVEAVKFKMQNEGLDPNILDTTGNIVFES